MHRSKRVKARPWLTSASRNGKQPAAWRVSAVIGYVVLNESFMSPLPARRTQVERRDESERRMLEVGVQLLAERGWDKISLMEVGVKAGYSRGLPAHCFGSKSEYLAALAKFIVARYCEEGDRHREPPGLEALIASLRDAFELAGEPLRTAITYVVLSDKVRTPPFDSEIGDLRAGALETIRQNLRAGIRNGEIRSEIHVEQLANVILTTTWGLQEAWFRDNAFDLAAAGEEFINLLRPGLWPTASKSDGDI